MGRKRRRRTSNPPKPQADPLDKIINDFLGEAQQTIMQGVFQMLTPSKPTTFTPPRSPEPDAKPAQVISVRTEK
jgi:hypothetical protein